MKTQPGKFYSACFGRKSSCLLAGIFCWFQSALAQDLPLPPAHLQTLPTGSYIIPMDNTHQLNAGGLFNIKSYGLVVHLLNNNVKVKWVIRAGKAKDATDFTAAAFQVSPTVVAGSSARNFKGGPFVIFQADTSGVAALVSAFNATNALTGSNRPKMFQTTADVLVDIRYDLSGFKPKAAILNDGGNEDIHRDFMVAASMPAASYAVSYGRDLMTGCYTFASEPHNDQSGPIVDSAIKAIRNFVVNGGNFLAQCAAVTNYENNATFGRFQTTTGATVDYTNLGDLYTFANPDLSFTQFEGAYDGDNGVVDSWKINAAGANNQHAHMTGTGANSNVLLASVSKLSPTYRGGLVFYLANHDYRTNRAEHINGLRMYMNAFLTPSIMSCSMSSLPARWNGLEGSVENAAAALRWAVPSSKGIRLFEVQKSTNGQDFVAIGSLRADTSNSRLQYSYTDPVYGNPSAYYRLKIVQEGGTVSYSNTLLLHLGAKKESGVTILENPIAQKLSFRYNSAAPVACAVHIYNAAGLKVHSSVLHAEKGSHPYSVALDARLGRGTYFLILVTEEENHVAKFIKQ